MNQLLFSYWPTGTCSLQMCNTFRKKVTLAKGNLRLENYGKNELILYQAMHLNMKKTVEYMNENAEILLRKHTLCNRIKRKGTQFSNGNITKGK